MLNGMKKGSTTRTEVFPKRTPECPPERQTQIKMDPEEKLLNNVHGKTGRHMV